MKYYQWHQGSTSEQGYAQLATRSPTALVEQNPRHIEFFWRHPESDRVINITDSMLCTPDIFRLKKNRDREAWKILISERAYHVLQAHLKKSTVNTQIFQYDTLHFYGLLVPSLLPRVNPSGQRGQWKLPPWPQIHQARPQNSTCFCIESGACFVTESFYQTVQEANLTGFELTKVYDSEEN